MAYLAYTPKIYIKVTILYYYMKKVKVNFWITEKLYEKMLERVEEEGYSSISDFIRDAIRRRLEE